jgi:hypothetical protein
MKFKLTGDIIGPDDIPDGKVDTGDVVIALDDFGKHYPQAPIFYLFLYSNLHRQH